jgi:periplasmic protein TonB
MISEEQRDKKNKRVALLTSLGIHGALLIIFFFLMAWRAPNPPLPEFGVELNFGLDDEGGGEVQPQEQLGSEQPVEDQLKPEEVQPQQESKVEEKPEEPVVSNVESPVVVKEVKTEKKEPVKDKPKEKVAETKPKEEKKEVKETAKATETKKGKDVPSHGDNPGKMGDKGSPEGKPDAKALYGKQGGGGGGDGPISLNMSGWTWADQPRVPDLPDNEDGRIEFEIECDESGDIIGITTLQRGLSPRAEQLLKDEIRKNSLVRTSGGKVPERSKGKVVFILKTK